MGASVPQRNWEMSTAGKRYLSIAGDLGAGKGHDKAGLCIVVTKAKEGGCGVVQPARRDTQSVRNLCHGGDAQGLSARSSRRGKTSE